MNVTIDNYDDAVRIYLEEVAEGAPLTGDEEMALWKQTENPDTNQAELAKKRLLESRLKLVVDIAARHASSGVSMLDLIQEGNIGLLVALNTLSKIQATIFRGMRAFASSERSWMLYLNRN